MLERVKGIEPSYEAWEAAVLPLNYTRIGHEFSAADDDVSGGYSFEASPWNGLL
jgi:hypothetical protein